MRPTPEASSLIKRLRFLLPANRTAFLVGASVSLVCLIVSFCAVRTLTAPWEGAVARRVAEGKQLLLRHYISAGNYAAALGACILSLLLLLTCFYWSQQSPGPATTPTPRRSSRFFWPLLFIILSLAAILRIPAINSTVTFDEQDKLRRNTHGWLYQSHDGSSQFERLPWTNTLWENGGGNNHILYSVLSRVSMDTWRKLTGAPNEVFSRWAMRVPSLLGGLLCILLIALLGQRLVSPEAGLLAALLLAVHPGHIDYSLEARGYSLMMAFGTASWLAMHSAFRHGTWSAWIAFASAQLLALLSNFSWVYVTTAATLLLPILLWHSRPKLPQRVAQATRWLVTGVFSFMIFLIFAAPTLPQARKYLADRGAFETFEPNFLPRVAGILLGNIELRVEHGPLAAGSGTPILLAELAQKDVMLLVWICASSLLVLVGSASLLRRDCFSAWIVAQTALGAILMSIHTIVGEHGLHPWYYIFALPALTLAVVTGVQEIVRLIGAQKRTAVMQLAYGFTSAALILLCVFGSLRGWETIHRHPGSTPIVFHRGNNVFVVQNDNIMLRFPREEWEKRQQH